MRTSLPIGLLELLGYDPAVTAGMAPRDVAWLAWAGLSSLTGALLFACAGAYLVHLGLNAGRLQPFVVAVTALLVFSFALNLQRMFVTSGGHGYHGDLHELNAWKPDSLRLGCVLFLALLFAQPLLLLLNRSDIESKIEERVQAIGAVYRSTQLAGIERQGDELLKRRAWVEEKMRLLGMPGVAAGAATGRKALVVGMQGYRHLRAPGASLKNAADMRGLLESMGYETSMATEAGHDDLLLALDRYLKRLQPGDISVVYYAGLGAERNGQALLLPLDAEAHDAATGVKLAQLMEDIAATRPRASVLLADARLVPAAGDKAHAAGAWPRVSPPANTLFAAANPGARADGGFTQALLRHLGRGEDIDAIMQRIAGEPGPAPVLASTLKGGYTQLSGTSVAVGLPIGVLGDELGATCPELGASADVRAVKNCLASTRRVLETELAEVARRRGPGLERKLAAYRDSVQRSGMVRERWRMLWADAWRNLGLMLLCIVVMSAGDLLRDLFPGALRRYEAGRTALGRALVERRFGYAREKVGGWLANYPAAPLPGARWHEVDSFFELGTAAVPLPTPAFESHGSADDLLDRLAWDSHEQEVTR